MKDAEYTLEAAEPPLANDEKPARQRVRIRQASWADYPRLCHIAITDAVEEREGASHFPPPKLPDVYLHLMDLLGRQIGWLAEVNGDIVGVVFLVEKTEPHNGDAVFLETAHFWVIERHRKSANLGSALLQIAKQFADKRGQPLKIATNMGKHPKVVDRYMAQQGFSYLGGTFWRDPNHES